MRPNPKTASPRARPSPAPPPVPLHFAPPVVVPQGDGTFLLKAGKPVVGVEEITTVQACCILKCCRAQMWYIRDLPAKGVKLEWRYSSPKKGKVLWNKASVLAYLAALEGVGK